MLLIANAQASGVGIALTSAFVGRSRLCAHVHGIGLWAWGPSWFRFEFCNRRCCRDCAERQNSLDRLRHRAFAISVDVLGLSYSKTNALLESFAEEWGSLRHVAFLKDLVQPDTAKSNLFLSCKPEHVAADSCGDRTSQTKVTRYTYPISGMVAVATRPYPLNVLGYRFAWGPVVIVRRFERRRRCHRRTSDMRTADQSAAPLPRNSIGSGQLPLGLEHTSQGTAVDGNVGE